MNDLIAILASVTAVSLIAFIGIVFIGLKEDKLKRLTMVLVGFASGTLIGGAFFHLLPESLTPENDATTVFWCVIVGIVSFFALEKFLYWRHCHEGECPIHTFVYLNLVGDGVHNFIDGMVIAGSFFVSYSLGIAATLGVVFHEIPQEIGDFGVLVYGGLTKSRALAYNFVSALTAVAGALAAYCSAPLIQGMDAFMVPFAAGGFIYIAATDLMPELHKRKSIKESLTQLTALLIGISLMSALRSMLA
ncbi:MAG: ZIP family metal transporter [Candidatus Bathyarchaeia archaeon]